MRGILALLAPGFLSRNSKTLEHRKDLFAFCIPTHGKRGGSLGELGVRRLCLGFCCVSAERYARCFVSSLAVYLQLFTRCSWLTWSWTPPSRGSSSCSCCYCPRCRSPLCRRPPRWSGFCWLTHGCLQSQARGRRRDPPANGRELQKAEQS